MSRSPVTVFLVALLLGSACAPPAGAPSQTPPVGVSETATALATATAGPTTARPVAPSATAPPLAPSAIALQEFPVAAGSGPHDVAPAADGGVWYTGQRNGTLGHLDPRTGAVREVRLGAGSSPHGVIVDKQGVAWVTDSGQNAIVSVDPRNGDAVKRYPLPPGTPNANLNTAVIDRDGVLWWTGQNGWFGRLDLAGTEGTVSAFQAPGGRGPYGITATPTGDVYYASLAGNHIARVVVTARVPAATAAAQRLEPPTRGQGSRRVWSDSKGNVWVSEYNASQVARFDPAADAWKEWKLPGSALPYSVFVDDQDTVWLTDFAASAVVRFDPLTERFDVYPHARGGSIRQQHGRPGEVWGALSAHDKLLLVRTR